jgi:hypothetical protein
MASPPSLRATGSRERAPDDRLREAIQSHERDSGLPRRLSLAMTDRHDIAFSRHDTPEVCMSLVPPRDRGRREDRVHAAPAVSCARCTKQNAHEHTGSAEAFRPSLRNGFNGFLRALPGDRLVVTVAPKKRWLPENLTPASGRQDHTTSPYASMHSSARHLIAPALKASIASRALVRDDRDTPLM